MIPILGTPAGDQQGILFCLQYSPIVGSLQVMSKAFELISLVATESPSMTKKDAFLAIGGLVDKMADIKLKGPAGQALTATSEALGPQFVCMQLHKKAVAHKNPKVQAQSCLSYCLLAQGCCGLQTPKGVHADVSVW